MTFFCPRCFAEMDQQARTCPACGADVASWCEHPYEERLLHALGHPLPDVRMIAIEALGRLRELRAAEPLAACALAHPLDIPQAIAVLRVLAAMPRDDAWGRAVDALLRHPARAVAASAAELPSRASAGVVEAPSLLADEDDDARIRGWIDDLANHEQTTEYLLACGERAIAPLRRYLSRGAQVIPQGRLLAVAMLARLHSPQAREGLRDVLHAAPLRTLPVAWRDAEYQVKDAAIRALLGRDYPERLADVIHAARHERLPSAVAGAGELGMASLAPDLVAMLADDVLEAAAAASIEALGASGQAAILHALQSLFDGGSSCTRCRLALIRALLLLHRMRATLPEWAAERAHADAHPCVRGAGALGAAHASHEVVADLLRGALSDYPVLAMACRDILAGRGFEFTAAASDALQRNAEPDIYGNLHPLRRDALRWLLSEMPAALHSDARARMA
jgi:hypothetical protein